MANAPRLSVEARNAGLDASLNTVGTGGELRFYEDPKPTNANTALSGQELLASLPLSSTPFASASGGSKATNAITSAAIAASGDAGWCSFVKSDGTRVWDLTVGTSGADVTVNSTVFTAGVTLSCSGITASQAAG